MTTTIGHYGGHLAPIYLWMVGGMEAAIERAEAEITALCPGPARGLTAADLGCGLGMHAIALAKRGYSVLAIDNSSLLLEELRKHAEGLPLRSVEDDLCHFWVHLEGKADLIVCMGDTLTHLQSRQEVEQLFSDVAAALKPGGAFVSSFRDYSVALTGAARFIPVRSDSDRILTCFLEYSEETVAVHDILYDRSGANWRQRVSVYRKLRLSTEWVTSALRARGLSVRVEQGGGGLVRVVAEAS